MQKGKVSSRHFAPSTTGPVAQSTLLNRNAFRWHSSSPKPASTSHPINMALTLAWKTKINGISNNNIFLRILIWRRLSDGAASGARLTFGSCFDRLPAGGVTVGLRNVAHPESSRCVLESYAKEGAKEKEAKQEAKSINWSRSELISAIQTEHETNNNTH